MARLAKPFSTPRRVDSKTFQLTLNPTCGLPHRVCAEWQRRSFQELPDELAHHRYPKTKAAASAGALALVTFLKKKQEEGSATRVRTEDITVGEWVEKFTRMETSPRTGINASKNRPYSVSTVSTYRKYFTKHIEGDEFCRLKMAEVEEEDALEYMARLSLKELAAGRPMSGSRTFAGVVIFIRMAFKEYQRKNRAWLNPFLSIDKPQFHGRIRDTLSEDEVIRLFAPGVLESAMELAICAVMFLSGLRRGEIFALKPECLDWHTPKITVRNAWQNLENRDRVLGPTKSKREREAPFDPVLQEAIKKLWKENGRHEFVFSYPDGKTPGPSWISGRFPKWLKKAGVELKGRKIVPHGARHSLASLLEDKGVSMRHIQELLGHSDLKTTKIYLHSTEKTIRDVGRKISETMERGAGASSV